MFTFKRHLLLLCGLIIALFMCMPTSAQTVTGTISGTVIDSNGALVPGATVTLINEKTGDKRTVVTNDSGRFTFAAIQPDFYTVRVEKENFQTFERKNTVLSANETLALGDIALTPGRFSETVTVTSEGQLVEKESSDLSARLTADQIESISTKGRDITSLLRLLPGTSYIDDVESVGEGFGTDLPNISGMRGRSTVSTVDGLNASEPSGSNKLSMTINQDAVAEVKVLRNNYAAEYGNNGGALINIVSKGGTKRYAGAAYYFLRNESLNANTFFGNRQGLERPLYRHNIWGLNFSGPVQIPWLFPNKGKDKLFFFVSYERPHTIQPTSVKFVQVPTELERRGDFSQSRDRNGGLIVIRNPATGQPFANNIIPPELINPNGQRLLNVFPLPNQLGGRTLTNNVFNYFIQKSVDTPKRNQVIRFDYKPTNNDSIYVKMQWWRADNEGFDTSGWPGGDANRWGISSHYLYNDNGMSINWTRVISASIVNEFFIGARHDSEGFIPSDGEPERLSRSTTGYNAGQLFSGNNTLGTIPRATFGGLSNTTTASINWLDRWGEIGNDYTLPAISDNLSYTRGSHNYKAGIYIERLQNGEAPGGNWSGTFNFTSSTSGGWNTAAGNAGHPYANALLGTWNSYTESFARPHTDLENLVVQWYGQDQWKINRKFTLNYGVRFLWYQHWRQRNLDASSFDPERFNPANAQVLYRQGCNAPLVNGVCPTANRRALNPVTGELVNNTNLIGTFVPGVGDPLNGIVLGTDPSVPKGFKDSPGILYEPRVGFAWDLFGDGKTILRVHGGVYHAPRVGGGTTGGNLVSNPPFQRTVTLNFNTVGTGNNTIDRVATLANTALNRPVGLNAVERHVNTPASYNYAFGIQRELGFKTVMEVSYVGTFGRHLGERRNINGIPDTARFVTCDTLLAGTACHPENRSIFATTGTMGDDFLRPYQGYGDINLVMYSGTSNYNGLQIQVNRRYTKGFQFGVAYTYSKVFDYANDDSSDVPLQRPYKAWNYGPADYDQSHIFTANYIWNVPKLSKMWNNGFVRKVFDGWQISGTTSIVSGRPKDVSISYSGTAINVSPGQPCPVGSTAGTPNSTTGLIPCTPTITDWTGGEVNASAFAVCNAQHHVGANPGDGSLIWLDASCFQPVTLRGQIGNIPRNGFRRPGVVNSDLAFFKRFSLGERRSLQFRWEMYNIFNRANFNDIDGGWTWGLIQVQSNPGIACSGTTVTSNICTTAFGQTNSRFGQATGARSPRVMQGSLRFTF